MTRTLDHELHPESITCGTVILEGLSIRPRNYSAVGLPNVSLPFEENATAEVESTISQKALQVQRQSSMKTIEKASCKLEPRIEGRIVIIDKETLPQLLSKQSIMGHPCYEHRTGIQQKLMPSLWCYVIR